MGLTVDRLNDINNYIKNALTNATISSNTWLQVQDYLGNDLSSEPTPTIVSNPTWIELVWGASSGGIAQTTNSPGTANGLNFGIFASSTARTVVFNDEGVVTGVMQLSSDITAGSYGAGCFLEYVKITTSEEVA